METIFAWKARRSGGRITIRGVDDTGADVRLANIDTIELTERGLVAKDKDGDAFLLSVDASHVPARAA